MDERPHYEDLMHRQFLQLDELYGAFAKSRGESYLSLWTLCELGGHPEGLNHKQMAETLHLPKQTVSSIVASFEQRGLASSGKSPHDGRSRTVRLTEAGRARYEAVSRELEAVESASAGRVGAGELDRACAVLSRYADALSEELSELVCVKEGAA